MPIEQLGEGHWGRTSCLSLLSVRFSAGIMNDGIGDAEYGLGWLVLGKEVNEQKVDEQS
jgi:hypothetical protein